MSEADRLVLTAPQRSALNGILSEHGSRFDAIVAYGSRATGMARRGSDLDLAMIGPDSDNAETALWLALEESDLPLFCDLTLITSSLEPAMRSAILRDGIVLAGNRADEWRSLIP